MAVWAALFLVVCHAEAAYFTTAGGVTNWDNVTTGWSLASGGPYSGTWTAGSDAVFEGAGRAVAVGAVTCSSITFTVTGYILAGGSITLVGAPVITANSDATINSVLAGPGMGLFKEGAGVLTLGGINSYDGSTIVNTGRVTAGNSAAFGTNSITVNYGATVHYSGYNIVNPVVLNGGALYIANGASGAITLNNATNNAFRASGNYRVISGKISGPGGIILDGGDGTCGVAWSNPLNDFQGNVLINSAYGDVGRLRLDANEVIPDAAIVTMIGGYLRGYETGGNKTETIAGLNGNVAACVFAQNGNGITLRIGTNDTSSVFAGKMGADWDGNWRDITIIKTGKGTFTLGGASTFFGGTVIREGTVAISNNTALGVGPLTMAGGTLATCSGGSWTNANTVNLLSNAMFDVSGGDLTLTGSITNSGALGKTGQGTLFLSGSANTGTLSRITVDCGLLDLGGAAMTVNDLGGAGGITNGGLSVNNSLSPGTNGVAGVLTVDTNLTVNGGVSYEWVGTAVTGSSICVTGLLSLPSTGTVNMSAASYDSTRGGTLFTFGSLAGTDFSGWVVMVDGVRRPGVVKINSGNRVIWNVPGTVIIVR